MDDNLKVEKWTLEDGRRAERRVVENAVDGQMERVVELHVEDQRPLRLQQRVVEKSKPVVVERRIETIDPMTGQVVEQKIEAIEPKVQMQVVEHIACSSALQSQKVAEDCDCHVTKEEMIEAIVAGVKAARSSDSVVAQATPELTGKLKTLGLADEIGSRPAFQMNAMDKILLAIIAAQIVGLGYIVFFM